MYEYVTKDSLYVVGKVKDVLKHLKEYEQHYATIKELTSSKLKPSIGSRLN